MLPMRRPTRRPMRRPHRKKLLFRLSFHRWTPAKTTPRSQRRQRNPAMLAMCRAVIAIRAARMLLPWPSWHYQRTLRLSILASVQMALGPPSWRGHPVGVPLPPCWLQETLRAPWARTSWYPWAR